MPPSLSVSRQWIIKIDWVVPLLTYYNDIWNFDSAMISRAAQNLSTAFADRSEREALLYNSIFALKSKYFERGSFDFEDYVTAIIEESRQTGATIARLGQVFGQGNRIDQIILVL